jgi:putative toxin-antitoxin system antitoxin component (TIGR02293 family)
MGGTKASPKAGPKRKTALLAAPKSKTASSVLKGNKTWKLSYLGLHHASPLERISLIKKGVPASTVKDLFVDLHIAQGVGFKALNLSTATVNKKAKKGDVLSSDESERVIGFAKLVGQLEAMIQESGDGTGFDAHAWIARWLTEPLPAFGGVRPVDLIDTMEGQGLVSSALAKSQSGAYA